MTPPRKTSRAALLRTLTTLSLVAGLTSTIGCGSADSSRGGFDEAGGTGGGAGVGQGGAQDFGEFKKILEDGDIPSPETIDDIGFFNEHKIELPPPDCGEDVCLHGELGVMGNMISGSNCTLIMLGMNTPIDPKTLERPPMNLVLVIDTSGSMAGESIAYVRSGLTRMLDDLQPEDNVSLVRFSSTAEVLLDGVAGDDASLGDAIFALQAGGSTNIYDGLRTGYDLLAARATPERQNRIIFLSDGVATAGITSRDKILAMSASYAKDRLTLSTIGLGSEFDPVLMRTLAEESFGAFYFLQDVQAVEEVFEEEVQTFLYPLAYDVSIDATVTQGYRVRGVYGTKTFEFADNDAQIDIPMLQIAHRTTVNDNMNGRRGGGGAMILELLPRPGTAEPAGSVGELQFSYRDPASDQFLEQTVKILSPLKPGETPTEGLFSAPGAEKSFVMLNIYMGFRMAAQQAEMGDLGGALSMLLGLDQNVSLWLESNPDADIEDDLRYIRLFEENLRARQAETPPGSPPAPEPWPQD